MREWAELILILCPKRIMLVIPICTHILLDEARDKIAQILQTPWTKLRREEPDSQLMSAAIFARLASAAPPPANIPSADAVLYICSSSFRKQANQFAHGERTDQSGPREAVLRVVREKKHREYLTEISRFVFDEAVG